MASLNYKPAKLNRAQRRALARAAKRDTQLQYAPQAESISDRQSLEAGQGALIDSAYERYKQQLRDSEAQRTAANAAAVQGITNMVNASGTAMQGLAAVQGAEQDAMNRITGATASGGTDFRAAMLKSLQQQGADAGQSLVEDQTRRSDYTAAQTNQGEADRGYYRQKSADRSMKLADEQARLRGTMAKAEQARNDQLLKEQFERWMGEEKVKLANREVNVDDANTDADRSSREGSASYRGATGGGDGGGGGSAPSGLPANQQDAWERNSAKARDKATQIKRLLGKEQYRRPGNKPDWPAIWRQVPVSDPNMRLLLQDITYPGRLGKTLGSVGKSAAMDLFYGKLPSWLKNWNG
jgi:hypothetical protein